MDEQHPSACTSEKPISPLVEEFRRRMAERPGYFGEQAKRLLAEGQTAPKVITLYVRRGESERRGKTRVISLHPIPDKVGMDDLLAMGFAFDGDTVSLGIASDSKGVWVIDRGRGLEEIVSEHVDGARPSITTEDDNPWTLAHALNSVQTVLVHWLRKLGYEVKIA